jgi:hypothetical protein
VGSGPGKYVPFQNKKILVSIDPKGSWEVPLLGSQVHMPTKTLKLAYRSVYMADYVVLRSRHDPPRTPRTGNSMNSEDIWSSTRDHVLMWVLASSSVSTPQLYYSHLRLISHPM